MWRMSVLSRERKLKWIHVVLVLLSPKWLLHLWIRNVNLLLSAVPFFHVSVQYMIFSSSPTLLNFPFHIFGQEPATQTQGKGLKGDERHGSWAILMSLSTATVLLHQQIAHPVRCDRLCTTKLSLGGWGWGEGILKNLKSRCYWFSSQLQQPQLVVALQWVWW